MLAVIKLRLFGLKEDYKIMLVMALLALGMVYAFSSSGSGSYDRTLFVTDLEQSELTEMVIKGLDQQEGYQVKVVDLDLGRSAISNNDGLAQLVFDTDFTSALDAGELSIRFISSKNDVDTMNVKNVVSGVVSKLYANKSFSDQTAKVLSGMDASLNVEEVSNSIYNKVNYRYSKQNPYEIIETTPKGDWNKQTARLHNFFGFALLFSAYTIVFGVGEILNDKANHTWDRLIQSPVSTGAILFANMSTTVLIGLIQMGIIFIGGQLLFGIEFGASMIVILLICTAYIFSLTGMGLLLASVLKNHGQLSAITPILLTSFAMLGGCMWPLEIVTSKILLGLSFITPHRWALEALENVTLKGLDLSASFMGIGVLLLMGTAYATVGGIFINRRQTN